MIRNQELWQKFEDDWRRQWLSNLTQEEAFQWMEDAQNVWLCNGGKLDLKYIEVCLKEFAAADGLSDILDRWAQIRKFRELNRSK